MLADIEKALDAAGLKGEFFHLLQVPALAQVVRVADISVKEQRNMIIRLVHVLRLRDEEAAQALIDTCYEHIKDIPLYASAYEAMIWGDVLGKAGRFKAAVRALNIALEKEGIDECTALSARRFRAEYTAKVKRPDGLSNWAEGERLFEEIPEEARDGYYWLQRADVAREAGTGTHELGYSIERAKEYYGRALGTRCNNAARVRLGEILLSQGQLDAAEEHFRSSEVTSGHRVYAAVGLGQIFRHRAEDAAEPEEKARLRSEAQGWLLKATLLDPSNRRSRELLRLHASFDGDRKEEDRWKKELADLDRLR